MGIEVLVPDVNESVSRLLGAAPSPTGGEARSAFGLSAVRNVGEGVVALHRRASARPTGPFADFYDFCDRVDPSVLNKRTIESLIKAGAFDSLGHPAPGPVPRVRARSSTRVLDRRRNEAEGQFDLFSAVDEPDAEAVVESTGSTIPDTEFAKTQRLAFEKEMLGLYVSDHPLMGAERALRPPRRRARSPSCARRARASMRTVGGIVTALQPQVHQARRPHGHVRARGPRRPRSR